MLLLKTARYRSPFCPGCTLLTVKLVEVAPVMLVNVAPLLVLSCHCTVTGGSPWAAAVNVTGWPALTVVVVGGVVISGAYWTVSVAALVVVVPTELVKTARYSLPSSPELVVKLSVALVAPLMFVNAEPPSVLSCHCTVALGSALAAAVNVAVLPALTVRSAGGVVTCGTYCTVSVAAVVVAVPMELVKTARYSLPS